MKKLFLTASICLFMAVSANASSNLTGNIDESSLIVNCFGEWTAAYNGALEAGFSTETALEIARRVFEQCAFGNNY
jgi:hypothetical protein